MPVDSIIVSVCVVAMFVVFAAALVWGDRQTRPERSDQPRSGLMQVKVLVGESA